MEVYAALGDAEEEIDDDRDHLEEIQDLLERLDDVDDDNAEEDVYQQLRFDLCAACRQKFLRDPMGRQLAAQFEFSKN